MPDDGCARAPLRWAAINSATAATTSGRATAFAFIWTRGGRPDSLVGGWPRLLQACLGGRVGREGSRHKQAALPERLLSNAGRYRL